jgi:hypothetical protein
MEGEVAPGATHGHQEQAEHVKHSQETQTDNSQSVIELTS